MYITSAYSYQNILKLYLALNKSIFVLSSETNTFTAIGIGKKNMETRNTLISGVRGTYL